MNNGPWFDNILVREYDAFVERNCLYWSVARALLQVVPSIDRFKRILDLGCGTAVVSRILRRELGFEGTLIAADSSPQMLHRAEMRCKGMDVMLIHIDHNAPCLSSLSPDLVVCNSAVWQLNQRHILSELDARHLCPAVIAYSYPVLFPLQISDSQLGSAGWHLKTRREFIYEASPRECSEFAALSFNRSHASAKASRFSSWKLDVIESHQSVNAPGS